MRSSRTKLNDYPPGWTGEQIRDLAEHFDRQSDEEAIAEDEAAFVAGNSTFMEVPRELVSAVRELIDKHLARG